MNHTIKDKHDYSIYGKYISDSKHTMLINTTKEQINSLSPKNKLSDWIDKIDNLNDIKNTFDASELQQPEFANLEKNINHLIKLLMINKNLKVPEQLKKGDITTSWLKDLPHIKPLPLKDTLAQIKKNLVISSPEDLAGISQIDSMAESDELLKFRIKENIKEYLYEKIYASSQSNIKDLLICVRNKGKALEMGEKLGLSPTDQAALFAFLSNYTSGNFKEILTPVFVEDIAIIKYFNTLIADPDRPSWKNFSDMSEALMVGLGAAIDRKIELNEILRLCKSARLKTCINKLQIPLFENGIASIVQDKRKTPNEKIQLITGTFICAYDKFLENFKKNSFVRLIDEQIFEEKIKSYAEKSILPIGEKPSDQRAVETNIIQTTNEDTEKEKAEPLQGLSHSCLYSDADINNYIGLIIQDELGGYKL